MKIRDLRVGDTWIWNGHRRYIATTPMPIGNGVYAFDTHLGGPGGAPEHHRMNGNDLVQVEATR